MAGQLKVTRLDSPLGGLRGQATEDEGAPRAGQARTLTESEERTPGVVARPTDATPAEHPAAAPRPDSSSSTEPRFTPERDLWEPPAWGERVELFSTRLPVSLSRALERHTRTLRDRHDLASQKALPMQEVLAAVVWALGDPDDQAAVDRLDAVYRSYRSRRMAAAARALEQS
jgi:hypothetical protein